MGAFWAPSHISMVFAARPQHESVLKKGSIGMGVCLEEGVRTSVTYSPEFRITYNDININSLQGSSRQVFEVMRETFPLRLDEHIHVKHESRIPISAGLSSSAAGAIGTALGLNEFFDLGLTVEEALQYAHIGEIRAVTGLGDVLAISQSGVVIRKQAGAPGYGLTQQIPLRHALHVGIAMFQGMSTKHVLENPRVMKEINDMGGDYVRKLLHKPSLAMFFDLAFSFSIRAPITTEKARSLILRSKELEIQGIGLAMIGQTIYFIDENKKKVRDVMRATFQNEADEPSWTFMTKVTSKRPR